MANARTIARLQARILQRAAHCIEFELNDPRRAFITLTRVELSSDLSAGKIYYSVLGTKGDRNKAARMLEDAAGFIQRQVASVLKVRRVPRLRWFYDESIAYAAEMDKAISAALHRDRKIQEEGQAPAEEEEQEWEEEYESSRDELEESE